MVKLVALGLLIIFSALCVIGMLRAERRGEQKLRMIPAVPAISEAISRAVEMGRPVLFHFGDLQLNARMTRSIIPGLSILDLVARRSGELGAHLIITTSDPMQIPLLHEIYRTNFILAKRSENEIDIRYLGAPYFPYAASMMGLMKKEQPGTHIMMGSSSYTTIVYCETGNSVGSFQVAGSTGQLPALIASCDYTMLGEEYMVAGAMLSEDLAQLGCVVGEDWSKIIIITLMIVGSLLAQLGVPWIINAFT